MSVRSFNFNAGPAAMPLPVLEKLQSDLVDYRGRGLSVLEMSHRSNDFIEIAHKAESDLRTLLAIPEHYAVLFMQGGASTQFALTVSNLDTEGTVAFANTGYWSRKAIAVARQSSTVREIAGITQSGVIGVESVDNWRDTSGTSYLHVTDNETIDGIQLDSLPVATVPLIADMSSSILSRPLDIERYGLIYAGAQKNIGPAGITVVIVRRDLLKRSELNTTLAPVFSYAAMDAAASMLNTPPTFAWYAAGLVFQWLLDEGGLSEVAKRNERQANAVYSALDTTDVYINRIAAKSRSLMNIPFHLQNPQWQDGFLRGASERHLTGLKGHKSVGGMRASLYNAVTDDAVSALVEYLHDFARNPQP